MDTHWEDAYCIAERMFKAQRPSKRTDLNVLEQIICSKYKTIFEYDALTDEYSFIPQELMFEKPVPPFCRNITEADLDEIKKNTVRVNLEAPSYMNITPICVVPPSSMLVFNYTQTMSSDLTEALQNAKSTLTVNTMDSEVRPGGEFVFKHKDEKCYRCIVISQVAERSSETERRYEVAFLDHCQIVQVKLKTLFMPVGLGLDKYPCALHIVRPIGIAMFRSGFVKEYDETIRAFYNEKTKRKNGLMAILYKTDEQEMKLIIDFPSFHGNLFTNSEEVKMIHGHQSLSETDPFPLTYEQVMNKVILPLEYPENNQTDDKVDKKDQEASEEGKSNQPESEDDDVELDLSDVEPTSSPQKITLKDVATSECPLGRASMENFIQQHIAASQKLAPQNSAAESLKTLQPSQAAKHVDGSTSDTPLNESMSSLRSGSINQTCSSSPTPQPTFDEIQSDDRTPRKSDYKVDAGSSDGWDTPKKSPPKLEISSSFGAQKPLMFQKKPTYPPVVQTGELLTPVQSIERPSSPVPNTVIEKKLEIPSTKAPVPLMSINTQPKNNTFGFGSFSREKDESKIEESRSVPQPVQNGPKGDGHTSSVDHLSEKENRDRTLSSSVFSDAKEEHPEHAFQSEPNKKMLLNADASHQQSDLEDDIFGLANNEERYRRTSQDANQSRSSINQRMINNAQDNFHDSEDLLETSAHDIQNAQDATVFEHVDSIVVAAANEALMNDDDVSRNSACSEDFRKSGRSLPKLEVCADSSTAAIVDEFSNVLENMKELASSFIRDINDAAVQKNPSAYFLEIAAMEVISQKFSDGPNKRFWKSKIAEARNLEGAFD